MRRTELVKSIFRPFFYFSYKTLCRLLPSKNNMITFMSSPDASDNSWHLYKYLTRDLSGAVFVWLVKDQSIEEKIISECSGSGNRVIVLRTRSFLGLISFVRSKINFNTHGTYFFVGSAGRCAPTIVNLWHGMPIKNIGAMDGKEKKQICYSDYVLATSEFYKEIMARSFDVALNRSLVFGLPRNDVLIGPKICAIEPLLKLGIPKGEKFIFWLPTYRVSDLGDVRRDAISNSFLDELCPGFIEELEKLAKAFRFSVIIKLHPMDSLNNSAPLMELEKIKFFTSNQWKASGLDLYEILSLSDGLISDVSSVIIDYLGTGKGIGVLKGSFDKYTRSTAFDLSELKSFSQSISSPRDILSVFDVSEKKNWPEDFDFRKYNSMSSPESSASKRISDFFLKNLQV